MFVAMLYDDHSASWCRFSDPLQVLTAQREEEVNDVLAAVEQAAISGRYVVGYVSYEAAHALDPALDHHPQGNVPLAQFGIFSGYTSLTPEPGSNDGAMSPDALDLRTDTTFTRFQEKMDRIRAYLQEGDSYQVNYTHRLQGNTEIDAEALFWTLHAAQPSSYAAFIETATLGICSVSPELFFERSGTEVTMQPMKGTRPRGRFTEEDEKLRESLSTSEKDRAENLMIVDMIRNDLGRIAEPGSVRVDALFRLRQLPTVWQQVSDVSARSSASLTEIFRALFPCASVTGAPKAHTMEIIREIEDGPRGVYTGAIGLVKPGGDARFSVAIRTLTVDRQNHELSYGVGGGIVWDSGVEEEWQECRDKARVLKFKRPSFSLLETMRYEPGQGVCLAHRHRQRMQSSAAYFGIHFSEEAWQACVESVTGNETLRLRLLLSPDGDMQLEQFSFADDESEVILGIAREPVSSEDIFLFHKTTHRDVYERAKEGAGDCDDVVLYNELDEITETTIANLFLEFNGELLTPARESGLLAGTYRQEMLDEGRARESLLSIDDLHAADRIYVANTLRGIRPARLI